MKLQSVPCEEDKMRFGFTSEDYRPQIQYEVRFKNSYYMSPYSLFSGECSVVVTTLYPTTQGSHSPNTFLAWQIAASATNQRQSPGGKQSARAISLARFFPNGEACTMLFSMEVVKKDNFHGKFLTERSRTIWVQILRIVRKHKDETVNIFSNNSHRQFFSYYIKFCL